VENRFPRITSDLMVNAGLPSIRDTDIAAFLVVRQRIDGKSISEIIDEFPNLQLEDIEEAQAYILHSAFSHAHYVVFDLRPVFNTIYGVADFLHDEDTILQEGEKKQLIDMLFNSKSKASRVVDPLLGWLSSYTPNSFHFHKEVFTSHDLFDGIEDAAKTEAIALKLKPSKKTQSVVGIKKLVQDGIRWVVIGSSWYPFQSRTTIEVIANQTSTVSVIIRCPMKFLEDNNALSTHFLNPTSVGSMCLVRAGLKPSIQLSSTDMTYQFDLPMSKSDEANNV
jgi:uncharacterized protein (DUF433 family)